MTWTPFKSTEVISSLSLSLWRRCSLGLPAVLQLQQPAQVSSGAALFTQSSAALIKPWREAGEGRAAADRCRQDMMWISDIDHKSQMSRINFQLQTGGETFLSFAELHTVPSTTSHVKTELCVTETARPLNETGACFCLESRRSDS